MERNDRISVRKSRRRRVDKIEELKVKRLSGLERFTGVFRNGHTGEALSVEWVRRRRRSFQPRSRVH